MKESSNLRSALAKMGVALVNATLMLGIILALMIWLVFGQVRDIAGTTRASLNETLTPVGTRLEKIASTLDQIDQSKTVIGNQSSQCEALTELRSEIATLREDIQATRQAGPRALIAGGMRILEDWVSKPKQE